MIHNCHYLDLLKQIPNESVSLVLTDPPFGINYQNTRVANIQAKIIGDETLFSYRALAGEAYRILKPNTACFMFTGWSMYPFHFMDMHEQGFRMKEPLICQKKASGSLDFFGSFMNNADWILFGHKGVFKFKQTELLKNKRAGTIPNKGKPPVKLWKTRFPACWFGSEYPYSTANPSLKIPHPTPKNVEFIEWLIQLTTNEGDTVVDPFVGSGTVALACERLGRQYIVGDISKEFCELAQNRLDSLK